MKRDKLLHDLNNVLFVIGAQGELIKKTGVAQPHRVTEINKQITRGAKLILALKDAP
jgi:hypothetical protein